MFAQLSFEKEMLMRYIFALLVVLIPMAVRGEPSAKAPPAPVNDVWTKKVFDAARARCEKGVHEDEPHLPRRNLRMYCFCFVSRTKEAFPRGVPEVLNDEVMAQMERMVLGCYARHVVPWIEERKKQKKPDRGKKGTDQSI